MGVGIGGLITNLMQGDPSSQIASALAGPNPNPQAAAGGPPGPTGAPGPGGPPQGQQQQQLPPAQAYAPDPANASTIAMLLRVHQQDMASNDLNTNINRMAAGFGTAQQQHDKMAALGAGGGGGDTLGALGEIMKLQNAQFELQQKQRFQASASLLAQSFGFTPQQGQLMSSDPQILQMALAHKMNDASLTDQEKMVRDWEQSAKESGISPQEIQQQKTMLLGGMVGGQTPDQKNMNRDIALWQKQNPGKDPSEMPQFQSLAAYKGFQEEIGKAGQAAGQAKENAKIGLPALQSQMKPAVDNINQMFGPDGKVKPEVIAAIQSGDPPSEGWAGAAAGALSRMGAGSLPGGGALDPNVLNQKNSLTTLQNQFNADAMSKMKNIRTQREFTSVGGALTSMLKKTNTADEIQRTAEQVRDKFNLAMQNATAAGGGEIPAEWADKVDKEYLPGGDLYNGATIAKPSAGVSTNAAAPPVEGAKQAPDGHWYVPDPKRPGKYLRVE